MKMEARGLELRFRDVHIHDMSLEHDLLRSCACHKVRMAARSVTRTYDEVLRPTGLRATQLALLVAVATGEAPSIAALAQVLGMDRSTLTRNLGPLESEGLVAIGREGWRRSRNLEITRKGRERLSEALPLWKKAQETLKARLGERAWKAAHSSFDNLIGVA
jgi:DNA-binding MarR family transcriptional regulator